jgi:phospholipid transport system substrate-binding protein
MRFRLFFIFIFAVVFISGGLYPAQAGEPTHQVKQSVDKVLDILKDKELKKPSKTKDRRAAIRSIVSERFDFEEMAKRSLALHWRTRTPEERKEFVSLFTDLLERSYIKKIETYTDEKINYTAERIEGDYADVNTKILTKRNVEIPIEYRLIKKKDWQVYDVVIEGVSLINNYRTQFNKVIRTNSYAELVKRMKNKQEEELFEDKTK